MADWNPWHGCKKKSEGCVNCYVYSMDERHGKDASEVTKLKSFYAPVLKNKNGEYKISSGELVWTCFTSDFLLEEADIWREEAWGIIRERSDLQFLFITKRIERLERCVPDDWGDGYDNVRICCTVENQKRADERLPVFLNAKIKHKEIICEPLLEAIDLSKYLSEEIIRVSVGGESGLNARICNYDWVLSLHNQCKESGTKFTFRQTGRKFLKDNKLYTIQRKDMFSQARKARLNL